MVRHRQNTNGKRYFAFNVKGYLPINTIFITIYNTALNQKWTNLCALVCVCACACMCWLVGWSRDKMRLCVDCSLGCIQFQLIAIWFLRRIHGLDGLSFSVCIRDTILFFRWLETILIRNSIRIISDSGNPCAVSSWPVWNFYTADLFRTRVCWAI